MELTLLGFDEEVVVKQTLEDGSDVMDMFIEMSSR